MKIRNVIAFILVIIAVILGTWSTCANWSCNKDMYSCAYTETADVMLNIYVVIPLILIAVAIYIVGMILDKRKKEKDDNNSPTNPVDYV